MDLPDFDAFLPQEGYTLRVDDVEGIDLYEDAGEQESIGDDGESPPDFTAHLFRSNDFNVSYMESEPGGVLDWHTHSPHMYQLNMPVQGRVEITYLDEEGDEHVAEAGPEEMVYLPPGAHNKVKAIGDETLRLYVIYRQIVVPQVEEMVGVADQHPRTNPGLEIDTLRGIVHALQDDAVEPF
ncbi:cupin domain-containing protein [Halovivax cerinus]|uniref:Cupin domain-containing protein n=1 Tax=Halovivax cerinus TaxID=1487865 RepID=A0ABD5NP47_9EURY|nr:cupin domain-containing protein [Halovivax cerinus]